VVAGEGKRGQNVFMFHRTYSCFMQPEIVAEIEAEQRLVEGNRQPIERMEQKIAVTLARICGENSTDAPDPIELAHASNVV